MFFESLFTEKAQMSLHIKSILIKNTKCKGSTDVDEKKKQSENSFVCGNIVKYLVVYI